MEHLETIFLTILWKYILERMNTTSKVLQSKDVNILVATNLLESLKSYLQETRDKFTEYEFKATSMCLDPDYYEVKNGNEPEVCVLVGMIGQEKSYF